MTDFLAKIGDTILPVLPPQVAALLCSAPAELLGRLTEIRLRVRQPLLLVLDRGDIMVTPAGQSTVDRHQAYCCGAEDIGRALQLISRHSIYALEEELKTGFITIAGGHRVGIAGQAIVQDGRLAALKNISSLNYRVAREVTGCADKVLPYLVDGHGRVFSTLIVSPPRCGKTTLLRDIIRQLSNGREDINLPGMQVGVVDERSEIGACRNGIPTNDLGLRTDVLDACPKATGMLMLIRSMSPAAVATDEIGRAEDVAAIQEALHAGVSVLATVHARSMEDLSSRPYVSDLIRDGMFERYVVLSNRHGVGTMEKIIAGDGGAAPKASGVRVCG